MIKVEITANSKEEFQEALAILGHSVTQTSLNVGKVGEALKKAETPLKVVAEKVKSEVASGEKDPQTKDSLTSSNVEKLEPQKAAKITYFNYLPENKCLVIKKGAGLPVEAIAAGDAVEITKAEYDKLTKKKAEKEDPVEDKTETSTATEDGPSKEDLMAIVKKGADLKLHEGIKQAFAEVESSNGKFGGVDESRYAELKIKLEELIAEAE